MSEYTTVQSGSTTATDTAPTVDAVVFDLGGMLVDWNPRYLYRKMSTAGIGLPSRTGPARGDELGALQTRDVPPLGRGRRREGQIRVCARTGGVGDVHQGVFEYEGSVDLVGEDRYPVGGGQCRDGVELGG